MSRAQLLFEDYKYYRKHTKNVQELKKRRPYLRDLKPTKQRLALFDTMDRWCEKRSFDSRMWLYSLFVARRWRFAPKLESSNLLSEKHIDRFHNLKDFDFFRQRLSDQERIDCLDSGQYFDPNRDMSGTAEAAKRAYQQSGRSKLCMEKMQEETFGYHPRSKVCALCSIAMKCYQVLQSRFTFDVMALRLGQITAKQARQQALISAQGYGNAGTITESAAG